MVYGLGPFTSIILHNPLKELRILPINVTDKEVEQKGSPSNHGGGEVTDFPLTEAGDQNGNFSHLTIGIHVPGTFKKHRGSKRSTSPPA